MFSISVACLSVCSGGNLGDCNKQWGDRVGCERRRRGFVCVPVNYETLIVIRFYDGRGNRPASGSGAYDGRPKNPHIEEACGAPGTARKSGGIPTSRTPFGMAVAFFCGLKRTARFGKRAYKFSAPKTHPSQKALRVEPGGNFMRLPCRFVRAEGLLVCAVDEVLGPSDDFEIGGDGEQGGVRFGALTISSAGRFVRPCAGRCACCRRWS